MGYEKELETIDIGSNRYVFATILYNCAQSSSLSSPSQTLYGHQPTDYKYDFV